MARSPLALRDVSLGAVLSVLLALLAVSEEAAWRDARTEPDPAHPVAEEDGAGRVRYLASGVRTRRLLLVAGMALAAAAAAVPDRLYRSKSMKTESVHASRPSARLRAWSPSSPTGSPSTSGSPGSSRA